MSGAYSKIMSVEYKILEANKLNPEQVKPVFPKQHVMQLSFGFFVCWRYVCCFVETVLSERSLKKGSP